MSVEPEDHGSYSPRLRLQHFSTLFTIVCMRMQSVHFREHHALGRVVTGDRTPLNLRRQRQLRLNKPGSNNATANR